MAIDKNSDYNKPFMDLFELLPEVYRSDTNRALFKNVFNRYLSKPELTRVQGYVGQGNINAITRRQIPEDDPHRQAYQLQPVLFEKVGSVEHLASWKDILTEVTRLGVDEDRYDEWGAAVRFAWAPPVDIDKLIHYRDYYWFDEENPNSRPEYITIRSRCTTATSNYNYWLRLIDSYGATVDIDSIDSATNELMVAGDLTTLYEPGFVFFVKDSTNPTAGFNDSYHTVKTAVWDVDNAVTRMTLEPISGVGSPAVQTFQFTSEISDGVLSLEEQAAILQVARDCLCGGTIGWDVQLWDDNPEGWNVPAPYTTSETAPVGSPQNLNWYKPSADTLSSWDGSSWVVVQNNFSVIIELTVGTALWDFNEDCGLITVEDAGEQWAINNKWFHKSEVTNFSVAKQAAVPIIEYEWDLELNEWAHINHTWKYRDQEFGPFDDTTSSPTLIELEPFTLYEIPGSPSAEVYFDERYGDLTDLFVADYQFVESSTGTLFTVASSRYHADGTGLPYRTKVTVTDSSALSALTGSPLQFEPRITSLGDDWRGYDKHWVYVGVDSTTPVNHQVENTFASIDPTTIPTLHPSGDYLTAQNYYVQEYALEVDITPPALILSSTLLSGTTRSLQVRARVGFDDIRVYLNNVRQFGNYDEITGDEVRTTTGSPAYDVYDPTGSPLGVDDGFVKGVRFHSTVNLEQYDEVRIEVGAATLTDMGWTSVPVRMEEDDVAFLTADLITVSLVEYHKVEQIKSELNQYPLFDIYDVEGNTTYEANPIFGYLESPDVGINAHVQKRIVEDGNGDFSFEQFLLKEDNGTLFAYRQYNSRINDFWYNPEQQLVQFWAGLTWTDQYILDNELLEVPVSPIIPTGPVEGQYWYDTLENELKQYISSVWVIEPDVTKDIADETLQTIWRVGLNKEEFVPQYVDEERRPDGTVWYDRDGVEHTVDIPVGDPDGDWQIPDQLYYNHLHENRVELTLRELFTHFSDIIDKQEHLPGFVGPAKSQFHLIASDDVNYGVGGTILEFNDGFDTFLSSAFVNNVTPLGIVEFAHDQYESSLVEIRELFTRNSTDLLTDVSDATFVDQGVALADQVITLYEENDYNSLIYGDSTTFNDTTDLGIRNWIATLPYIGLVWKHIPELLDDPDADILEVVHHDGHRNSYSFTQASLISTITNLVNTGDDRTSSSGQPPDDTFGRQSTSIPPGTETEFANVFATTITNRNGVYWYQTTTDILFRLDLAAAGRSEPSSDFPNGTLWFDTNTDPGILKEKVGAFWIAVPGLPAGDLGDAWVEVDLNFLLSQSMYGVEVRLHDNAPTPFELSYDFDTIKDTPEKLNLYNVKLQEAFADYVNQSEITAPFSATGHYIATDPFTWNYKHSNMPAYPSVANAGTETGGDWKDLYQKIYGTPYPHMEPWFMQQYTDKPDWWDEEYLNDSVASSLTWGDRRWKYTHGFTIVDVDEFADNFVVSGDFRNAFVDAGSFEVVGSTGNDGVYIVDGDSTYSTIANRTTIHTDVTTPITDGTVDGNIELRYGMWENILNGVVPTGRPLPSGRISTGVNDEVDGYDFFSVNISNGIVTADGGTTNYGPDDVFPPYWDYVAHFGTAPLLADFNGPIRSLFNDFATQIASPSADYAFGDAGPIEWVWRASSQFLYDQLSIAYQIDPARYVFLTFGVDLTHLDCLQIDRFYQKVYAHNRTDFHGEIVDNQLLQIDGTNQWYVNYNRFLGFDSSYSDFRSLWTEWTAPLTYQYGAFIDSTSLQVGHNWIDVTNADYDVLMKRSPGVEDFWTDAFNVIITSMPPRIIRYENEGDWGLEIQSFSPLGRRIQYYDVHKYEYNIIDAATGVCELYNYAVVDSNATNATFSVRGDHVKIMPAGRELTITESNTFDGVYDIISSVYDAVDDVTIIGVEQPVAAVGSPIALGRLTLTYRSLPWETGTRIMVSTSETSPIPLAQKEQYFVIKLSDTTFQLAETNAEAISGTAITYTSLGVGTQFIGQITTTFRALESARTTEDWLLYAIDKTNLLTFTPPYDIKGMQHLVDIIHGYSIFAEDEGFVYNEDSTLVDPDSGDRVSWLLELERYIDWAYSIRVNSLKVNDRYDVTVDGLTDLFTFTEHQSNMITGERVNILSSNGIFPDPIRRGVGYYIIRVSLEQFSLAATRLDATNGNVIDLTEIVGTGDLSVATAKAITQSFPRQEINAFRQMIWFKPAKGIVSDTIKGPAEDLRISQLLFDQYGRQIESGNLKVYREDKITKLAMRDFVPNDIQLTSVFVDPYNFIHFGGAHVFVDTYEHVLQFNNYTTEGCLIYDPFIGLNTEKFELAYFRQTEKTGRPNVGGHFLSTFFNQGAELLRNLEALTNDMRMYYDTYVVPETIEAITFSRELLGYEGEVNYLKELNLGPKSQFLFWKGMIQRKGSLSAVQAFINSRRFIDAKVDEFWAVKIAEFGSTGPQIYPEMFVNISDTISNELPIWMDDGEDHAYPELTDFTRVLMADQDRWYEQPNQLEQVQDTAGILYLDGRANDKMEVTISPTAPTSPSDNDAWLDTTGGSPLGREFRRYNASTSEWDLHGSWTDEGGVMYLRHGMNIDKVRITMDLYVDGKIVGPITSLGSPGETTINLSSGDEFIRFGGGIEVYKTAAGSPIGEKLLDASVDYSVPVNLSDSLLANVIELAEPLAGGESITIIYKTSSLIDSPIDAVSSPNSNAIIVGGEGDTELLRTVFPMSMTLWGISEDKSVLNPMKIIDKEAGAVISQVPIWDPSKGIHYYQGVAIIDLENETDPALYDVETPWNSQEVGTVWSDTKELDYLPYSNPNIFTEFADRSQYWGQLADWAELALYEWTESSVPPADYDALASTEEVDSTIPEDRRASGIAKQTLYTFEKKDTNLPPTAVATYTLAEPVKDDDVANIWIVEGTNGVSHPGSGSPAEFTLGTDGQTITFTWGAGGWDGMRQYTIYYIGTTNSIVGDIHQEWDVSVEGVQNVGSPISYNFDGLVDYDIIPAYRENNFVDVYVNGLIVTTDQLMESNSVDLSASGWNIDVNEGDVIRIRRSATLNDTYISVVDWEYDYQFTQVDTTNINEETTSLYYFWVWQKKTRTNGRTISLINAQNGMISNPEAFAFYQRLQLSSNDRAQSALDQKITNTGALYDPQDHYVEVIVRGLHGLIQDDRRYVLRFLKDYTLRDNLNEGTSPLQLKNLHVEWEIFRQEQLYNVKRDLWDKITESMIGYKLTNANIRVPSLDRDLYDSIYGTDTRFGIGEGQAFTDGPTAIATITAYLQDGENDFSPVDIDVFFDTYSFDTADDVVLAMNTIYNTFSFENVNRMYFEVLHDAFSFKSKYEDIFKTSMISLHGIKPFQVAGVFDD